MYQLLSAARHQGQSLFRVCRARSLAALKTTYRPQSNKAEESVTYDTAARPFEEIPGPKGLPLIGTALEYTPFGQFKMITNLRGSFRERTRTYGSIYRERIGPLDLVVISDPTEIEKVFRNEGRYPERIELASIKVYREIKKLPAGLINLNGPEWQRVRSSVQKDLMRPKTVGAYASLQDDVTRDLVDVIRALIGKEESGGQVQNFINYVYRWALEAISVVVLDKRLGCLTLGDLQPGSDAKLMIDGVNDYFASLVKLEMSATGLYKYVSTPTWRKFAKAIDQWHLVAAKLLKEKLAKTATKDGKPAESDTDFLQSLLSRSDVTFEEAMLMAVDLMAAGIDTSGNTLMFNLFCLAKNPEAQEKLYREIQEVVPAGQPIDDKVLNRMHYLRAVVKETFRVYPTVLNNVRRLDRDIVLSGYVVPAKECIEYLLLYIYIYMCIYISSYLQTTILMAHDVISSLPEYYPEPEVYRPERWLRDDESSSVQPFTLLPFGYGPRMCIGRRFAEQELHLGLIRIVQNFHVGWAGEDMKQDNRIILAPDRDSFVFSERT
ncbi:probable cytochrome P450 49a1 [Branchiostoma floridae]|uniref:Probable cytochrome P450 49a1 n=1 Tax=Branchiostoma floridae TaxID=7739 RepID=A0A9J7LVT5_BRAFL|nr:probable cytochrome P450 49a1 [Branchiostoma floridae]